MKILIAKDEAFNFIYRANVDWFKERCDVSFFSPLHDSRMPEADLLYLPGGYPELFVKEIGCNAGMLSEIKTFAESGGHVYAECGGFMYLCRSIDEAPMCGVLPFKATMQNARLHLGYRQMRLSAINGTPLAARRNTEGAILKGHEFHYSDVVDNGCFNTDEKAVSAGEQHTTISKLCLQQSAKGSDVATALYAYKNVVAGYTHWYWAETGFPFFNDIKL